MGDSSVSGDSSDPDGDGLNNRQEYLAGTDPKNAASVLRLNPLSKSGAPVQFSFSAVSGKTYTVQVCGNPAGPWTKMKDIAAPAADGVITVQDSNSANPNTRYYRIVTPQQP